MNCTFKPTVLTSKQDLTWSTPAQMTEQAHSWFNSLGSSDLVHHRNCRKLFLLEKERLKSARADENTGKSRQWGYAQKAKLLHSGPLQLPVFPPTENSRTERIIEKDRSGGGNHLDKFDKLRRWRLFKRWGRIKLQERAKNSVSPSSKNSKVFPYHKGQSRFYIR